MDDWQGNDYVLSRSSYHPGREWLFGGSAYVCNLNVPEEEPSLRVGDGSAELLDMKMGERSLAKFETRKNRRGKSQ